MPRTVQSTMEEDDLAHTSTIDIVQPTIGNQNKNVFKNNLIFLFIVINLVENLSGKITIYINNLNKFKKLYVDFYISIFYCFVSK